MGESESAFGSEQKIRSWVINLNHVFSCLSKEVVEHRHCTLQNLEKALDKIDTPQSITHSIVHSISTWTDSQSIDSQQIHAPNRGSVVTIDVLLTQAFTEQTTDVGCGHFLWGQVSIMLGKAFSAYKSGGTTRNIESSSWVKQLVLKVWDYSISLRKFCNGIVHGTTRQEYNEKVLAELRNKVSEKYANYVRDPFIITLNSTPCFYRRP